MTTAIVIKLALMMISIACASGEQFFLSFLPLSRLIIAKKKRTRKVRINNIKIGSRTPISRIKTSPLDWTLHLYRVS